MYFCIVREDAKNILTSLENDMQTLKPVLKETATDILNGDYSKYPVFIAHQAEVILGEKLIDGNETGISWSINASTLEELVEKGIVQPDRVQLFKQTFKNPSEFACLFVIHGLGANFIFIPYASQQKPS